MMQYAELIKGLPPHQRSKIYRARDSAENFAEGVWAGESKWSDAKGWHTPFNDRGAATGFVYFVRTGSFVKIGFTSQNPYARMASLQTGCPIKLKMVGYVFADQELERNLHDELQAYRKEGEWFSLDSFEVRKAVRCVLNQDAR
jgi:hypothetical protein